MKKSNWVVYALAMVVSIILLVAWFVLGFYQVDSPLDLVITLIWWLVALVSGLCIAKMEQTRQERVRTCYLYAGKVYNSEEGTRVAASPTQTIEGILKNLSYGFAIADMPAKDQVKYTHIVRSTVFKVKKGKKTQEESSDWGNAEQEIEWSGEVIDVQNPNAAPKAFSSRQQLMSIIG